MSAKKKGTTAVVTDEHGTRFTPTSHTLADGSGETYGPNHPKTPAKVLALREDNQKPESE